MLRLDERFDRAGPLNPALRWHAEPRRWNVDAARSRLVMHTEANTDFWCRTHYGFIADNGAFLCTEAQGDFVLVTCVTSFFQHQYDQAGLMLRLSPTCWLKTSIEHEPDGLNRLGVVVTNAGWSDWSTQSVARDLDTVWLRLRTEGADCIVEHSFDGQAWTQMRIAHLQEAHASSRVDCGLYACSPKAAGYRAESTRRWSASTCSAPLLMAPMNRCSATSMCRRC